MELRVMALAAPEYPEGRLGPGTLTSQDPASLFNACRYAAALAESHSGAWANSNWAVSRAARRGTVLLSHSLKEDLPAFEAMLEEIEPNLLLVGAMTLSFPGALACARRAKEILGDRVCVILGGHHASETIYSVPPLPGIAHHAGSPLRLMAEGAIDSVFDLVLAGEGEHVVAALGERIGMRRSQRLDRHWLWSQAAALQYTPGEWILGTVLDGGVMTIKGRGPRLDRDLLPAPCAMFGVRSAFDVFGGRLTAHAFSDSGRGCVYDCEFCSERRTVSGMPAQLATAATRLFRQLQAAVETVAVDSPARKASAFVEDSTMLSGSIRALQKLAELLRRARLDVVFGGQLTIDQILPRIPVLRELRSVGLEYLFVGIETLEPQQVGGMSKDVKHGDRSWLERTEAALAALAEIGISCGAAVLFGLGETQDHRLQLFDHISRWRKRYGFPRPISMNWAVQHPLQGRDGGASYTYHLWGTPCGEYLSALRSFGEASVLYPLAGRQPPSLAELWEIQAAFDGLPSCGVAEGHARDVPAVAT